MILRCVCRVTGVKRGRMSPPVPLVSWLLALLRCVVAEFYSHCVHQNCQEMRFQYSLFCLHKFRMNRVLWTCHSERHADVTYTSLERVAQNKGNISLL